MPDGTYVVPSDSDFVSKTISVEYLRHYIKHSDTGPNTDWKLMLMDNHGSHLTPKFIAFANENHIRPYPLIPHMTNCMQPLDIRTF